VGQNLPLVGPIGPISNFWFATPAL
jgi:hypothetical protein